MDLDDRFKQGGCKAIDNSTISWQARQPPDAINASEVQQTTPTPPENSGALNNDGE
jgi:hypothetical protein